jgi:hypothetical protein
MSLFKQLEMLYRPDRFQREDFHTEIVAQVLRNSDDLTFAWLRSLHVTRFKEADNIRITTQETFGKLPGHSTDSRPDITIRVLADGERELIFIESKLDSTQGSDQLTRYAEQLEAARSRESQDRIALVFITRDYEAALHPQMGKPLFQPTLTFKPTRWFEFYQHLKAHVKENGAGLARELKLFMEENRMSLGNQFRSTDLVAMENFLGAKALMDETLAGEVTGKAWKILSSVSNLKHHADKQLREFKRYIVYTDFKGFGCLIGYWLPHENPDEPVWVGIELYSQPGVPVRREVIQAFRGWIEKSGGAWTGRQLDEETAWAVIHKGRAIQSLIGGEDHVRAIKEHLLQLLEEVGQFKEAYPGLPWATRVPDVETEARPEQIGSEATRRT